MSYRVWTGDLPGSESTYDPVPDDDRRSNGAPEGEFRAPRVGVPEAFPPSDTDSVWLPACSSEVQG